MFGRLFSNEEYMKAIKAISLLVLTLFILGGAVARAQSTNRPPTDVDPNKENVRAELKEIKVLAASFEAKRDAYLAQQKTLLAQLKSATADQRTAIRDQLQANRAAFLTELKTFRQEIQDEVREIKAIVHNKEITRLLDAGKTPPPTRGHKGQN